MNRGLMSFAACLLLWPVLDANAASKQMECMQGFHACMRENPGKMKICSQKRSACMKGGSPAAKKHPPKKHSAKPRRNANMAADAERKHECFKTYADCMKKRRGVRVCQAERRTCEAGEPETDEEEAAVEEPSRKPAKASSETPRERRRKKAAKKKAVKRKRASGPCWTMNVTKENCSEFKPKRCEKLGNAFRSEEDCMKCLGDYRLPMREHGSPIFRYVQEMKTCKEERRDLDKLGECIKTIKDEKDKAASEKYLKAQRKLDEIVAGAKASGIHGCGNFTRVR